MSRPDGAARRPGCAGVGLVRSGKGYALRMGQATRESLVAPTASVGPIRIEAVSSAPSIARRVVTEALAALGASSIAEPVVLLVSEIVSNSIEHTTCDHIALTVSEVGDRVRVESVDCDGATKPESAAHVRLIPGGFGLHIVDTVAEDWGVATGPTGMVVWFEVSMLGQPSSPSPVGS